MRLFVIICEITTAGFVNCLEVQTDEGCASYKLRFCSQIVPQSFNFIEKEVHICLGNQRRENNHSEKVDLVFQRLVAHHHSALFHHALLDDWSYLLTRKKKEKEHTQS